MMCTVAEYFAGIGLMRMGLEQAGWDVVFANDISAKKFEMYRDFFPGNHEHYVLDDVFNLDPESIPFTTLATCSFPCIDLSLAGNMQGIQGRHSSAFWGFIDILKAQGDNAPPLLLVENVMGWLHSNDGADFTATIKALNALGYACDVFTLDALHFTPQSRPRVFLIALRSDDDSSVGLMSILRRPAVLLPKSLRKCLIMNTNLKWFYNPMPVPPPLRTDGLSGIVEDIPDTDTRWWTIQETKRHLNMMSPKHRLRVYELIAKDEITYRTFYRRVRSGQQRAEVRNDDLSGCLRTAVGGSGKQFLIQAGHGSIRMRTMTSREYARLQGVPDDYCIKLDGIQALTGFGDAVCVPAVRWIAENALLPLMSKRPMLSLELEA